MELSYKMKANFFEKILKLCQLIVIRIIVLNFIYFLYK